MHGVSSPHLYAMCEKHDVTIFLPSGWSLRYRRKVAPLFQRAHLGFRLTTFAREVKSYCFVCCISIR